MVRVQVDCKACQAGLVRIYIGERQERGRIAAVGIEKQGKLVDEVAESRLGLARAFVGFRGKSPLGHTDVVTKIAELILFGFEIVVALVGEDEIEENETRPDEFGGMVPAIAQIFLIDTAIQRSRKQVVDAADIGVFPPSDMAAAFELFGEVLRPLAPLGAGESDELAGQEVAGMRGHNVEETSLLRRVAQVLDRLRVTLFDSHSERISAVSSWWSSTRRRRSPSPCGV